jgi:hypothetical protein
MAARFACALLLCAALAGASLAPPVARPANAIVYRGDPDLALAVSLVQAGSGPSGFSSHLLFSRMFGNDAPAENLALKARYGASGEADFFGVMDYTVGDLLRIVKEKHIALPHPDPIAAASPRALATRLYEIGRAPEGKYDVGYMIERLMTHPIHHVIMRDIDARYDPYVNATFHIVLTKVVFDAARRGAR